MAEVREESKTSAKVRDLIFAYERQSSPIEPLENNNYYEGRQRSKSIGNALSYKLFRQPDLEIHNILDIEKELVKIEAHLNYYEVYEKETHVAFQEQLFNVLTFIVSIDPEGHDSTIQRKKALITETQKLVRLLNSRLPFEGNNSYRGPRRIYNSNVMRREEAVIATTSVRTQEHRAIISSNHHSTLNTCGFKSEESLNSTRDSVDLSLRPDDLSSVDLSKTEGRPETVTPPLNEQQTHNEVVEVESNYIPSVSKLKKFFSWNEKSEVKVIPAAYSGVTRSQSLNLKTNASFKVIKRDNKEEIKKTQIDITETDEDVKSVPDEELLTTNDETAHESKEESVLVSLYVEPTNKIEKYRDAQKETQHNVSVSKLKGLFEDKRKETEEGLGVLANNQTEFRSLNELNNLPYTEANLGAFRLKRTISGNYMNFAGLLRNVDIHKKAELNKSKSMSDLKSSSLRHDGNNIDDDLMNEIDDDGDFEHVSINVNVGKEELELNNNSVENTAQIIETTHVSEELATANESSETFVTGKVEILRNNFESLSTSGTTSEQKNENIKHAIHRTIIHPIAIPKNQSDESILKVPIQLRTDFSHVSHSEEIVGKTTENEIQVGSKVETASSVPAPVLSVPVQLRVGVERTSNVQETKKNTAEDNKGAVKGNVETVSTVPAPVSKVPIQLKVGVLNTSYVQETKEKITESKTEGSSNVETASTIPGPVLKVPVQLRVGVVNASNIQETKERITENRTNVESNVESSSIADVSPALKVSADLPISVATTSNLQEIKEVTTEEKAIVKGKIEAVSSVLLALPIVPVELSVDVENVNHLEETKEITEENKKVVSSNVEVASSLPEPEIIEENKKAMSSNVEAILSLPELEITLENKKAVSGNVEPVSSPLEPEITEESKKVVSGNVEAVLSLQEPKITKENKKVVSCNVEAILNLPEPEITEVNQKVVSSNVEAVSNLPDPEISEENKRVVSYIVETVLSSPEPEIAEKNKNVVSGNVEAVLSFPEPVLKVPVQLRADVTNTSPTQEAKGNITESNAEVDSIVVTAPSDPEPALKVPVDLRVGVVNTTNSSTAQEAKEIAVHNETVQVKSNVEAVSNIPDPVPLAPKVPVQLTIGVVKASTIHQETQEISADNKPVTLVKSNVETDAPSIPEPVLVEVRVGAVNTSHIQVTKEHLTEHEINEEVEHVLHKTTISSEQTSTEDPSSKLAIIEVDTGLSAAAGEKQITAPRLSGSAHAHAPTSDVEISIKAEIDEKDLSQIFLENERSALCDERFRIWDSTGAKLYSAPKDHSISQDGASIETSAETETKSDKSSPGMELAEKETLLAVPTSPAIAKDIKTLDSCFSVQIEQLSTTTAEESNENVKYVRCRPTISSEQDSTGEPPLTIPIAVKIGILADVNHNEQQVTERMHVKKLSEPRQSAETKDTEHVVEHQHVEGNLTSGRVETLTQTFEHLSAKTASESSEDEEHVLHKTTISIEQTPAEEPLPKPPTEVTVGFLAVNHGEHQVTAEETSSSKLDQNGNLSGVSVEVLTEVFENLSRRDSQDSSDNVHSTAAYKTVESVEKTKYLSEEPVLKVVNQARSELSSASEESEPTSVETSQISNSEEALRDSIQESTKSEEVALTVPLELRVNDAVFTYEVNAENTTASRIPIITLYNGNQSVTEQTESKEQVSPNTAQAEKKPQSPMKILESPGAFSTLISSSSYGQQRQHVSSSSKVSVSYSQKSTVQHTSSTHVSHSTVSSSSSSHQSSELANRNLLQVSHAPSSYSFLTLGNPDLVNDSGPENVAEIEDNDQQRPKYNFNVSQENIFKEELNDSDAFENVDEEFEKLL